MDSPQAWWEIGWHAEVALWVLSLWAGFGWACLMCSIQKSQQICVALCWGKACLGPCDQGLYTSHSFPTLSIPCVNQPLRKGSVWTHVQFPRVRPPSLLTYVTSLRGVGRRWALSLLRVDRSCSKAPVQGSSNSHLDVKCCHSPALLPFLW